jgi:hypothetical protein
VSNAALVLCINVSKDNDELRRKPVGSRKFPQRGLGDDIEFLLEIYLYIVDIKRSDTFD